jgi:riboflavin-specific deaminase-like protein
MNPESSVHSPQSLPFVFVNMAMTADGKIATANRAVSSFTSRRDHDHLLELRATADAVISGARTVDSAKINMGPGSAKFRRMRVKNGLAEYNLRVVVSGSGTVDPNAEVFKHTFSPIIVLTTHRASSKHLNALRSVAEDVKIFGRREIDFAKALPWLSEAWGVKRLLCEGGGELNDALFRAGLVDEMHLTISSKIFGGRNAPTICDGNGFDRLQKATALKLESFQRCGDEVFAVFHRAKQRV